MHYTCRSLGDGAGEVCSNYSIIVRCNHLSRAKIIHTHYKRYLTYATDRLINLASAADPDLISYTCGRTITSP